MAKKKGEFIQKLGSAEMLNLYFVNWWFYVGGVSVSDAEDSPYVLAPKGQRIGIASGLMIVGVGISAVMCLYPWR